MTFSGSCVVSRRILNNRNTALCGEECSLSKFKCHACQIFLRWAVFDCTPYLIDPELFQIAFLVVTGYLAGRRPTCSSWHKETVDKDVLYTLRCIINIPPPPIHLLTFPHPLDFIRALCLFIFREMKFSSKS